ncbi:MAG: CNNM domain-containing protein [Gammaproteobacteria bacterium]|nr:CNNM domain-containing protein [Gammaproteobacteria bacterium]
MPTWAYFAIIIVLVLIAAFFSGSEIALMRVGNYRLRHLSRLGHRRARIAMKLLERPDRLLSLITVGINCVNLVASSLTTLLALRLGGERTVAIATGILTLVVLIIGEMVPKTLGVLKSEPIAFGASPILTVLLWLLYPVVWALNLCANGILRLFGLYRGTNEESGVTLDELRAMVLESGSLRVRRRHMLLGALELEEATVEDIMIPRGRIEGVDLSSSRATILEQLQSSHYTHLPLYDEDIGNLIGMLHLPDLLPRLADGQFDESLLRNLAREAHFIPESTSLARVLVNFQSEQADCALVVDEYGDILGLITLEDMLSVIAGGLSGSGAQNLGEIVRESDGSLLVPGHTGLRTLNRRLGWKLPTNGPRTVNGLVLEQLQSLPRDGTRLTLAGHPIQIIETNSSGVALIRFETPQEETKHRE